MKPEDAIQINIATDLSEAGIDEARRQLLSNIKSKAPLFAVFFGEELHGVTPNSFKYDGKDAYKNVHLLSHKICGEWELVVSPTSYYEALRLAPQMVVSVTCDNFMEMDEWLLIYHYECGSASIWSPGA